MCFCRRKKTSSKEDAIDSSGRKDPDKQCRDQPLPAQNGQQMIAQPQPNPQQNGPNPNCKNNNVIMEKTSEKKGNKKKKSFPRENRLTKKRARKTRDDDTISNIPEEMPDLEINREHAEPFYTDDQLM
ncbi:hypothetical protein L3Y34_000262 [Caenorhabditis briggsae]|uniref:Uncharacterized protein n=1 Tax=Caenorhabditis briggsae TaxID=6238 RepID=A0AAE9INA7_CAEBR|nr:hypothetical protein L3Y34_000262 [Caenorhabditis briggsae]